MGGWDIGGFLKGARLLLIQQLNHQRELTQRPDIVKQAVSAFSGLEDKVRSR